MQENNFENENLNFNSENSDFPEENVFIQKSENFEETSKEEVSKEDNYFRQYIPFGFTPETYAEKKDIRRSSNIIAIPFILMFVIILFWNTAYFVLASIFGISPINAYKIISEPAIQQLVQIVISSFLFLVPFTIAGKIYGARISELCNFEKPEKGTILPYFLFGLGFCAFANISLSYASGILSDMGFDYSVSYIDSPSGIFGFILSVIATAIVPALVEEYACRGVVFGILLKYGQAFALIASSIIFGVMHGNFEQMPFAFMVGIILGYIRIKTNSIWVCVMVHGSNNLISVLIEYLLSDLEIRIQNVIYIIFLMSCLLIAIFALLLISKDENHSFSLKNSNNKCREIQKYKWFFSAPTMIVGISLYFIQAFSYFLN